MKLFKTLTIAMLSTVLSLPAFANSPNLDKINDRGTLRVGMSTFVPWAMRNKQGELIGFEIDVAKRLAKDAGWKVEFVPTAWDGIIPALLAKKFDVIIGGLTITEPRKKSVLFTTPYSHSGIQLAASKELSSDKTTLESYNSRRVKLAVRRGATTATLAKELFPKAKLLQFDDDSQAVQEVLNGNAHAVIASSPKPEQETIRNANILFLPFEESLAYGDEAFALRKDSTDLQVFFDKWIKARTDDEWLQERHAYWFKTLDWEQQID